MFDIFWDAEIGVYVDWSCFVVGVCNWYFVEVSEFVGYDALPGCLFILLSMIQIEYFYLLVQDLRDQWHQFMRITYISLRFPQYLLSQLLNLTTLIYINSLIMQSCHQTMWMLMMIMRLMMLIMMMLVMVMSLDGCILLCLDRFGKQGE